jgi:hypothetical protein
VGIADRRRFVDLALGALRLPLETPKQHGYQVLDVSLK